MWPTVRAAIGWVLELQTPRGEVAWERDAAGRPGEFALLSGCSSILQGLRCALALAELADEPQPDWELAADLLGHVLARHPRGVRRQEPVRDGLVLPGARRRAARRAPARNCSRPGWDTFVVPGLGVRCVSDQPWVTVAETCELVLSLDACGQRERAAEVFATVRRLRHEDGSYWTGWQYVNEDALPGRAVRLDLRRRDPRRRRPDRLQRGGGIFRDIPGRIDPGRPVDPESCGCDPDSATTAMPLGQR